MISGVILDIDGTLIDSNDAHARAWEIALKEHGYTVPFDRIRALIGLGADHLLPAACGVKKDDPEGEALVRLHRQIFQERFLESLRPFPGARALLEEFRARGMKLAAASSSTASDLRAALEQARLDDLLDTTISADDTARSKPNPDLIQTALAALKLAERDVIMVGDTPYDIEAAQAAGIDIVAFTCGGWDVAALKGAVEIYTGPHDLLYHFEKSVFGSQALPLEERREQFGSRRHHSHDNREAAS